MKFSPTNHRHCMFWLLTVLIAISIIEFGARVIEHFENTVARRKNPFVESINPVPAFKIVDNGGIKIVERSGFHPLMDTDLKPFTLERPRGGLRIFILGGSAAAGWPYHMGNTHISALLERKLQLLYPGRTIEVINAAAGTYASHRVKLIFEEVIHYNPDAIILYNGNNEFLENLVYRPQNPPYPWDKSAAVRFTYRTVKTLYSQLPKIDEKNYDYSAQIPSTLSFAFSKSSLYRKDPRQFNTLLDHYRFNIEQMVSAARTAKVPLFLATCPVNLKDWAPNVSRHRSDLSPDARAHWTKLFREGYLAIEQGKFSEAIAPLKSAIFLDNEYAEAHFRLAQALKQTGNLIEAKKEFIYALQRDANPFRELPEFQHILKEISARHGVPLVDIVSPLESVTKDGILGLDALVDYVHLTEKSQEIVAQELLKALLRNGQLQNVTDDAVDKARIEISKTFVARRDVLAADLNYSMAMLMHQHDRLDTLFNDAITTFRRAAQEEPFMASECQSLIIAFIEIHRAASAYRKLIRAEKLGLRENLYTPDEVKRIFTAYRDMIHKARMPNMSQEEFLRKAPTVPFQE